MSATVTEPTCSGDHMPRGRKLDAAENKLTNLKNLRVDQRLEVVMHVVFQSKGKIYEC